MVCRERLTVDLLKLDTDDLEGRGLWVTFH
jgi:hypothetical protein